MAKIRDDLHGVIVLPGGVILAAGDAVPAGVKIDAGHLDPADQGNNVAVPAGNASLDKWTEFLTTQGIPVPEGAKQSDLRSLWDSHNA